MLHLEAPTEGRVMVGGIEVGSKRRADLLHRTMQIVFQDPDGALNPKLTIRRSIGEALTNRGIPRREHRDRTASLLSLVGLRPDHMDRHPHAFSGGQKQRIVIARALAMEPQFLILDEPVSNLDVSIQAQIINLLLELKEELGLTYLFISHDLNLIAYVSDWIAVMKDGRIVEQDAAENLVNNPEHAYTASLFESAPVFVVKRRFAEHDEP
jgi:ABC-type dipeptide/oligopeptide/nickel transport system ATPase subunit